VACVRLRVVVVLFSTQGAALVVVVACTWWFGVQRVICDRPILFFADGVAHGRCWGARGGCGMFIYPAVLSPSFSPHRRALHGTTLSGFSNTCVRNRRVLCARTTASSPHGLGSWGGRRQRPDLGRHALAPPM